MTFVVAIDAPAHLADALAAARQAGRRVVVGWNGGPGDVCTGAVGAPEDAAAALLAAVGGAELVVAATGPVGLTDRLCDDLRRLGVLEVLTADSPRRPSLTRVQRELLEALAAGKTLGEAASEVGLPRRTADRRLADARAALGVDTTAAAIVAYSRQQA